MVFRSVQYLIEEGNMKTSGLGNLISKFPEFKSVKQTEGADQFNNVLGDFIKEVNSEQFTSKNITQDMISGKDVELHEVMIAGEKAKTSLELLMQIRNKTIDMYKELTRMQ